MIYITLLNQIKYHKKKKKLSMRLQLHILEKCYMANKLFFFTVYFGVKLLKNS